MNNYKTLFLIIGPAVFMTACSNDVFVDEISMPDEQTATVDGDGGRASFAIDVRGLDRISVDLYSDQQRNFTYYNYSGEIIPRNSPASEVAKMVYDNSRVEFIITKEGDRLHFESVTNTVGTLRRTIRLDYNYTVRLIEVEVLAGMPMQLLDIEYPDGVRVNDRADVRTHRYTFENGSNEAKQVKVMPYLGEQASILVDPVMFDSWVYDEELTIPVPVYTGGEWQMQPRQMSPGISYKYYRPDMMDVAVTYDVAPYASVRVVTDVTYAGATGRGTMRFVNPVTDRRIDVDFKCTSLYPVSYEIHLENAK